MPTKQSTAKDRSGQGNRTPARRQSANANSPNARSRDSGNPVGGGGRREQVGKSGVYPASGPLPPDNAPYQGMGTFGQGKRGAAGYEDSGRSEPSTYEGKKDLFGTARPQDRVSPKRTGGTTQSTHQTRRVPKSRQSKKGR